MSFVRDARVVDLLHYQGNALKKARDPFLLYDSIMYKAYVIP